MIDLCTAGILSNYLQVIKEEFAAEFKEKIGNKGTESFVDLNQIIPGWEKMDI